MSVSSKVGELEICPLRNEHVVPIVITPHKGFIPCMAVMLQSILDNSSEKFFYDIIILHSEIIESAQKKYQKMFNEKANFSIRFFDVSTYILRYSFFRKLVKKRSPYVTTFYRLLLPELLSEYEKVIYLDADVVVNVDISHLMEFDISKVMIGAVRDIGGNGDYYAEDGLLKAYRDKVLKLKQPDDYFNAGVFVMNIGAFREKYSSEEWWELVESYNWRANDQDVLNLVCNGNSLILPYTWNYVTTCRENAVKYMLDEDKKSRLEAASAPNIIHYVGRYKPWNYCTISYFNIFWQYALKTPFFEENFNLIGEDRLVSNMVEKTKEGRISFKTIRTLFCAWAKFQIAKHIK